MTFNRHEANNYVSRQAQLACLAVTKEVVAKARETNTPIIVFDGDRIQQLTADEYGQLVVKKENAPKNGEDHS